MNSSADIRVWLEGIDLAELVTIFEANHITPDMLHTLDADDLREMGITSLGHRKRLLFAIARLNTPATPPAPPEPKPAPKPQPGSTAVRASTPASSTQQRMPVKAEAPVVRKAAAPAPTTETPQPAVDPQSVELPPAAAGKKSKRKAFSASFLTVSISLHLILGLGAGYWVVQRIEAKRKLQFAAGPPTASPNKRALEHKVSLQKKKNAGGSPAQAKRISVAGLAAKITLPEMPAVPTTSTQFVAGRMGGMGGAGFGSGLGFGNGSGMGVGGSGAGGLGLTMFGARGGAGLTGTFYDLKRSRIGRDNGVRTNHDVFTQVLRDYTSHWKMPSKVQCYTGRSRLVAKAFMFPTIQDTEAGKAFNEPETGPGMWIAHYTGSVKPPVSGRYRFVGWGDNVLIAGVDSKVVLDASDLNYLGAGGFRNTRGSNIPIPGKEKTPLPQIAGSWFDVTAGRSIQVDILLGDEGGQFCAGLLLEKEGESAGSGKYNIPDLPMFLAGPLGMAEKALYDKLVSDKAFKGPVFNSSTSSSPMDAIRR